jgi:predicted nucleic acid-binding protein
LPCLAEFWSVVTHAQCPGRPSSPAAAGQFIQNLLQDGQGEIWPPGIDFGPRLLQAARQLNIAGSRIFDLQIGLIALEHGAREMWTYDQNFVAMPGLRVVDPTEGE